MKKYTNHIIVILTIIILFIILLNKDLVSNTIISSLYIWYNTLVPSMMPMIILSDILISYHDVNIIPKNITKIISKLFNISSNSVPIFLLSLVSGFPTNGISIKKAIESNIISKDEGEHLLTFCNFGNPLFILQTVGSFYLKSSKASIIILISHYLSNILIGIITRKKNYPNNNYKLAPTKSQSFGEVLSSSILKSINALLFIGVTVTLFLVLTTLITNIFHLSNISNLFIKSLLEMTMALSYLSNLNINMDTKIILSSMIISFSGLSIHLQIISAFENMKYKKYLKGRIICTILSSIIAFFMIKFI